MAGVDIRLATGKSVRDAYMSDNHDVRVGSGLQGLHHAKSVLVPRASSADWVADFNTAYDSGIMVQAAVVVHVNLGSSVSIVHSSSEC